MRGWQKTLQEEGLVGAKGNVHILGFTVLGRLLVRDRIRRARQITECSPGVMGS